MFGTSRWRVVLLTTILVGLMAGTGVPAAPAAAPTGCFTFDLTSDIRMKVPAIDEASGLVLSRQMPGVMWTHNDFDPNASDDENNRIYAVNESGQLLATVQFNLSPGIDIVPDATFVEIEDISFGFGPDGDPNYLYVGDTGDNKRQRPYASVYRLPEPVFTPDPGNPITINVSEAQLEGTHFEYQSFLNPAQTKAGNVEGVVVDPATGHLFLFEKGLHAIDANGEVADNSGLPRENGIVYRVKAADLFPPNPAVVRRAEVVSYVKANFGQGSKGITAADISVDGTIVALKNSDETFYWHRDPDETLLMTLDNDHVAPCQAPLGIKGEGLAIGPISDRFVMIREGLKSPIWQAVFTDQDYECYGQPATIVGTAGDDTIEGTDGNDVIVTFGGNDTVHGGMGRDRICLGPGDDIATGGKAHDRIDGGYGDDVLTGGGAGDTLRGRAGRDTLFGKDGADTLYGDGGGDTLHGGAGPDTVYGMDGPDTLTGNGAADTVAGGAGDDDLAGGFGVDACNGGSGTDSAAGCEDVTGVP